jgi:predicted phosphodiesterase
MQVTKVGNVITIIFDVAKGWSQMIMLRSDTHHDSVSCDRQLEERHLKRAAECGALIFDGGDLFDAMQGRYDPRRSYTGIRPEYIKTDAYYDNVTDDLYKFYKQFVKNWILFARGNHETAVIKNAQVDITGNLAHRLNAEAGGNVHVGGYGGWVRFLFKQSGIYQGSMRMKYFHGAGGEAPVTRGVIQTARQAVYLPNADIVWNGHNHQSYILDVKREVLNGKGNVEFDLVTFVRTPGYKWDYGDGSGGWEVERGGVPKPLGCAWVELGWDAAEKRPTRRVWADVE